MMQQALAGIDPRFTHLMSDSPQAPNPSAQALLPAAAGASKHAKHSHSSKYFTREKVSQASEKEPLG